jgi:hypothetical protein
MLNRNKSTASRNSSRYQPRGETEPASETGGAKALPHNRVVLADQTEPSHTPNHTPNGLANRRLSLLG